jgi:Domain of unknown function (DUF4397)
MIMKIKILSSLLAGIILIAACERIDLNDYESAKDVDLSNNTMVRFIHAFSSNTINTVTPVTATTAPPAFNFFKNGQRLNGATIATTSPSNLIFYFGAFPGVNTTAPTTNGSNGSLNTGGVATSTIMPDYSVFPGGITRVAAALNRLTGASPADTVITGTFNLENGKRYTMIAADTIPNQRFYSFEDAWTVPALGSYQIRIINLAPNVPLFTTPTTTLSTIDIFSRRRGGYIATGLPYRASTPYIEYPAIGTLGITNDTLEIRTGGSPTILAQFNGFFPMGQRVYTFVVRGMSNLASTNVRSLGLAGYINR